MGVRHLTRSEIMECVEHAWLEENHPTLTLTPQSTITDLACAVGKDPHRLLADILLWLEDV